MKPKIHHMLRIALALTGCLAVNALQAHGGKEHAKKKESAPSSEWLA